MTFDFPLSSKPDLTSSRDSLAPQQRKGH